MANREKGFALRKVGMVIAALVVAFAALNAFCLIYYTLPAHVADSETATDYSWKHGGYFAKATEGYAWGHVDENGYNNLAGEPENTSVLVMGSSHMEAMQVAQDANCAHLLGEMLDGKGVYNIGMSGHTLLVCIDDLEKAVDRHEPSDAVIIETATIEPDIDDIYEIIGSTRGTLPVLDSGAAYYLQRVPLIRLLYSQVTELRGGGDDDVMAAAASVAGTAGDETPSSEYVEALDKLLSLAKDCVGDRELIILYHPTLTLNHDEGIVVGTKPAFLEAFERACESHGITFVDMASRFVDAYETDAILPHGFSNTSVGAGHLNEDGHRMCAETLRATLRELGVA